jgi:putative Mn2+ efflux pump MntP
MHWLSSFIIANLIGLGSNLDNCGVGVAYGTEQIKIQHWVNAMINTVGLCAALFGTYAGNLCSLYISEAVAKWVACLILCAIGAFSLFSAYVPPQFSSHHVRLIHLQNPGFRQGVILGLALSPTNFAIGFSATVANAAAVWTTVSSIAVWGYIMVWLGNTVAIRFISMFVGKNPSLVAGLLLIGVGLHQIM